jgi:hypothetical protein
LADQTARYTRIRGKRGDDAMRVPDKKVDLPDSDLPDDEEHVDIRAEFKQAWRDIMTENVLSLDEMYALLDEIDASD